jgi:hypothetical protein
MFHEPIVLGFATTKSVHHNLRIYSEILDQWWHLESTKWYLDVSCIVPLFIT